MRRVLSARLLAGVAVLAAVAVSGCSAGSRPAPPAALGVSGSTTSALDPGGSPSDGGEGGTNSITVPTGGPSQVSVPTTLVPPGLNLPFLVPPHLDPPSCMLTLVYSASVLGFAFNSAVVSPAGVRVITNTAKALSTADSVIVTGYTSSEGSYAYNLVLSMARAKATVAVLGPLLPAVRVTAVGHGPTDPIASNATEAGRAENRRTVISAHVHLAQCTEGAAAPS